MNFDTYRYYTQKRFKTNQLVECLNTMKLKFQIPDEKFDIDGSYSIDDSTNESKGISVTELRTICEIKDSLRYISFKFPDSSEKHSKSNLIILEAFSGVLQLGLHLPGAEKSDSIFKVFEECLELEQCERPEFKHFDTKDFEERLTKIEEIIANDSEQITCFLSYRFTSHSKVLALELTRFLQLLGVTVVSGAGYEPRRVDEKVRARLEQSCDFIVYLVTHDGESTWTRDELVYSLGKGFAVVLLVESGAKIENGILGNWEYLEFQNEHIGDTFVGILEALQYIKREKGSTNTHA